jgi:hypothetical protein
MKNSWLRLRLAISLGAMAVFALNGAGSVRAQNPDTIPSEESAARTKAII